MFPSSAECLQTHKHFEQRNKTQFKRQKIRTSLQHVFKCLLTFHYFYFLHVVFLKSTEVLLLLVRTSSITRGINGCLCVFVHMNSLCFHVC